MEQAVIIAGTGHRPSKLAGGYAVAGRLRAFAISELQTICDRTRGHDPVTKILSGMALGWDFALAEAAIELKIPYVACIPFAGHDAFWPETSRIQYRSILSKASDAIEVSPPPYAPWKMQRRNVHLTTHCDLLLTLWNGSDGGTANCIAFAKAIDRKMEHTWGRWVAYSLCSKDG